MQIPRDIWQRKRWWLAPLSASGALRFHRRKIGKCRIETVEVRAEIPMTTNRYLSEAFLVVNFLIRPQSIGVGVPLSFPGRDDVEVSAVVEPRPGHSWREVVAALEAAGAAEIDVLDESYISTRAGRSALAGIEGIAFVQAKPLQQLR